MATGDERVARLNRALFDGRLEQAERLLAEDAALAHAHLGIACALYDVDAVLAALAGDPSLATQAIGPRRPILHLCFSHWHKRAPDKHDAMLAIAERLVACGADPNDAYPAFPDSEHKLSALSGALGHAANLPLARWLLEHGASPDDGESLYHATELGHLDGVRLLMAHGVRTSGTNAFYRMLDFDDLEGAKLFLDYGADPNEPLAQHRDLDAAAAGNTLHHAIRRGRDGRFADLLVGRGADPAGTLFGHTPYALAQVCGNRSMIEALERHGLATPLSPEEAFLAAVMRGDRAAATAIHASDPDIVRRLHPHDRRLPIELAKQPDRLPILALMHEVGFDFAILDEEALNPLHGAAWFGRAEYLPFLLSLGPDLEHRNAYGAEALGTAIHGSVNCPAAKLGDYPSCVRLLLDGGATIHPERGDLDMGTDAVTRLLEERRGRA